MKSGASSRPAHIVKGNIFGALGFSASEASALKIKAEILYAILEQVRGKGYTQAQLVDILDEYQPSVSNLLKTESPKLASRSCCVMPTGCICRRTSQYGP